MTRQAKKALLLFARASSETGASDPQKLLRLMNNARSDISFETGFFEDAEYVLTPKYIYAYVNGQPIDRYDVVYFRYWGLPAARSHALALARYCKLKKYHTLITKFFIRDRIIRLINTSISLKQRFLFRQQLYAALAG